MPVRCKTLSFAHFRYIHLSVKKKKKKDDTAEMYFCMNYASLRYNKHGEQ